jgi:peptide/nickel transport system substrate-binding protein
MSRRQMKVAVAAAVAVVAMLLAACGPTPTPEIVKEVVTQVVEVEKEVTRIVEGTPVVEQVVVTEVVEKEVPTVVEVETVVTATPAAEAGEPKRGGVLKAGLSADPSSLDPHKTTDTTTRNIFENVYDTLVAFDPHGNIVPSLAERWENPDDTTYVFHLREDVVFHDGSPFTADDVVFSIERIRDPDTGSPWASNFDSVESVTAQDPHTVVFKLKEPFAPFLDNLGLTFIAMMSKEALGEDGDASKTIVGTGPFKFVEFIPGQRLRVERNENYWKPGLPYLDGIDFIPFPDAVAKVAALRTGSADWIEYVPEADVEALQDDPDITILGGLGTNYRGIYFNTARPPFDDVRVRQAIAWALDRQEIVDVALFGVGGTVLEGGPIPPGNWAHIDYQKYHQDYDMAKKLLAEAGYPDGFEAEMLVNTNFSEVREPCLVIQQQVKPIGINFTLKMDEWVSYIKEVEDGNYGITCLGNSGKSDPDTYLYQDFHSKVGNNLYNWANPEFDALVEEGRRTLDQDKRYEIYEKAQNILIEEVPVAFTFASNQYEAMRADVKGYQHWTNTSYLGLATTWLDR